MPPRLILNADDFGLAPGINRAVEELYQAGAVTSATLMAAGPAFHDAIAIALRNPGLGVGCHVTLVDGTPVSPPASIPTLLGPDRRSFRASLLSFTHAVLRGAVSSDDLYREALAQTQKLQHAGLQLTHLDTHKHTHLLPAVNKALLRICEHAHIPAIRNPFESSAALALGHGSPMRRTQIRLLNGIFQAPFTATLKNTPSVQTTDGCLAVSTTGQLNRETLAQLLESLPSTGIWELITHPGYQDAALAATPTRLRATRDIEREALIAGIPKLLTNPQAPQLIHYGDLTSSRATP